MTSRVTLIWAALVLGMASVRAAEPPKHLRLRAVPFTEVRVQDQFWAPRIQTNREKSLPHNFKWCEQTGRVSNFAKAGKLMEGKFEGIYFNDSDVFKVLEGAAYSLADRRDPALEKTVDDVIAKIASAQQPDGYLNSYYTLAEPGKRWTNLAAMHELYCAGHMIEAAVAHYRATGKRTFLEVAIRYADHINGVFGPGKQAGCCGHEEIELALVKLYQVTGERRYLDLANRMLDVRGDATQRKTFGDFCQDHKPVRQQREIIGHAVRAMYLYSGVADVAAYTGDDGFLTAMDALWQDVVQRKLYITGGIGARHEGEAFGAAYELPNDSAYCETCAAIGLVLWAHRLNLLHGDAKYVDVLEQALYNGVLSGVALDGEKFFYVNPLASGGEHHRQPFFGCACCPSNVVRLVPSVPGYVYATHDGGIAVNLYVAGTATVAGPGGKVRLTQETQYPWDGKIKITLEPEQEGKFALDLRRPGWAGAMRYAVNGKWNDHPEAKNGYVRVESNWKKGDVVEIDLPMPVERIEAHPKVLADRGRVALRRGPIVYCFEAIDNGGPVRNIVLAQEPKFTCEHKADLLGGVTTIRCVDRKGRELTAVPYYAWDHRQPGEMVVWVRQDGKPRSPKEDDPAWEGLLYRAMDPAVLGPSEPVPLAELAEPTASFCDKFGGTVTALNDGAEPKNSADHGGARFTWYDRMGTKEWAQYTFPSPQKVSGVSVYWFDDGRMKRHCRVPQSWRVLYRDGDQWKPVEGASSYGVEQDRFNRATFTPVETKALRLEVQLQPTWSGGVLEWQVEPASIARG